MPFPETLEAMEATGYTFARMEVCPICQAHVEIHSTPGKREIVMDRMIQPLSQAVQHFKTCADVRYYTKPADGTPKPSPEPQREQGGASEGPEPPVKMYGVTDPNFQLLAVGWIDGLLVCQWAKGKGQHRNVPEDVYLKLRTARFAYRQYQTTVKGKFPYEKLA